MIEDIVVLKLPWWETGGCSKPLLASGTDRKVRDKTKDPVVGGSRGMRFFGEPNKRGSASLNHPDSSHTGLQPYMGMD